ncbi:MAG: signal peptidase I, partial [Bacteroides sp.]
RTQNNQLIYHQEGATKKEIDSAIQQYGSSNKYSVELSYQNLSKFLIKNGFDSKGLQGKSHFIYHLPLTQKMAEALATNTTLISHIIQEPIVKEQYDDSYQELLIYPLNKRTKWDKNEYGPLWIPKRGETIQLSLDNLPIYERCIRAYEGNTLEVRDNKIHINGKEATAYTFKLDYYWMMGDNRDNSLDSRYWGFVPEDHIVGKPLFVWLSLEKDYGWFDGHIRWSRFFKWIK